MNTANYHLPPGTLLDERYRIEKVIGEGGFGITYSGANLHQSGEKVAIKEFYWKDCVQRDCTGDNCTHTVTVYKEDRREEYDHHKKRFLKEARIIRDFSQEPGIVHIRDYFEENDTAYIVMDFLEGQTLKQYMAEHEPMEAEGAFRLLLPLMDTLSKVHSYGIIHRDISPDNIIISPDKTLTLIDFGAARDISMLTDETRSIILKGGFAPMEQYDSHGKLGSWTDVYALCGVLYFCITKHAPDDAFQRMLHDELAAPSSLGISIAPALEKVLLKGLSLEISGRYQKMDDLRTAIRQLIREVDPKETRRKWFIRIASAATILLVLGIVGFSYYNTHLEQFKFRDIDTVSIAFAAIDDATDSQYAQDLKTVENRIAKIAGEDNYIFRQTTDRASTVILPQEVFSSLLQPSDTDSFTCSMNDFIRNFIAKPGQVSINTIDLTPDDIESVKVKKGKIQGRSQKGLPVSAESDYYYLELKVSEEIAQKVTQLQGEWNETPQICFDRGKSFTSADSGNLRAENIWTYFNQHDYTTYQLVGNFKNKAFYDLLAYNMTQKPNDKRTAFGYIPPAAWEDVNASLIAGKYQKNAADIGDLAVYLEYTFSPYSRQDLSNGEWLNTISDIKTLLDSLEMPYAFGRSFLNDKHFVLKIPKEDFHLEIMQLLPETLVKIADFGGYSDSLLSHYTPEQLLSEAESPSYHWEYTSDSTSAESIAKKTKLSLDHGHNNIYLTVANYPLASGTITEPVTDGSLSFSDFYVKDTVDSKILMNFLNTMGTQITHNSSYELESCTFTEKDSQIDLRSDLTDFQVTEDPFTKEIQKKINKINPDIKVESERYSPDYVDLKVYLPYSPGDKFIENYMKTTKELLLTCGMMNSYYSAVEFWPADEKFNTFHLSFSTSDYDNYFLTAFMSDSFQKNYEKELNQFMNADDFYKNLIDNKDYYVY